jgi:hypothetical protein
LVVHVSIAFVEHAKFFGIHAKYVDGFLLSVVRVHALLTRYFALVGTTCATTTTAAFFVFRVTDDKVAKI